MAWSRINPLHFRRLLSLVFEPNNLRVKTKRHNEGKWHGALESCILTPAMQERGKFEKNKYIF